MSDLESANACLVDANGAVKLTITNSKIIVANNYVTSSNTDNARAGSSIESDAADQSTRNLVTKKQTELCSKVNENTLKSTSTTLDDDVIDGVIKETDLKILPQMRRITDYFTKKKKSSKKIKSQKKIFSVKKKDVKQAENEETIQNSETENSKFITFNDLVSLVTSKSDSDIESTTSSIIAIIAPAGAGKTTLLRRLANQTVQPIVNLSSNETTEEQMRMIHYLEMKDIQHNGQLKPSQLLFGGLYKNEAEEDEAYQWLIENQSKAILYLDGLNLAMWKNAVPQSKLRPYEKATWEDIMFNILTRNLLPHLKIVISSRDVKELEIPPEIRPDDVISLEGFAIADAESLFLSYIGDEGARIWENLKDTSSQIVATYPLFLTLLAVEIIKEPFSHLPVTMTQLYNKFVVSMLEMESPDEVDQIDEILKKLKVIAYQGMVDGRSVFYDADLKKTGLTIQTGRDVTLKASKNKLFWRHLLDGDAVDLFKTQGFQEYLSACYITEMEKKKFNQLTKKLPHENHWSVVWKFMSGIIHDNSSVKIHGVTNLKKKKKMFNEAIQARFAKGWNGVEFLAVIYESNDDVLIQSFPYLPSLAMTEISAHEAHMFGAVMAQRKSLEKVEIVDLWRCGINDNLIDVIVRNLKESKIQVEILNLRENSFTATGLNSILAHLDTDQIWIEYASLDKFRYADFDWNNIRKIDWKCFEMTNGQATVRFEGEFNGCYDKQEEKLSLFYKSAMKRMAEPTSLISFFDPDLMRLEIEDGEESRQVAEIKNPKPQKKVQRTGSLISWNFLKHVTLLSGESGEVKSDEQVYADLRHFVEVSNHNIDIEMKMVLLDCRSEESIDLTSIELCISKFKIKFLDVLLDDKTSFKSDSVLSELESRLGIKIKVHWWFKVTGIDDVTNLIPIVQENQVENLRLHFVSGISFLLASNVMTSCKITKLTFVHESSDKTRKKEAHKISKLAERNSIELELVLLKGGSRAWQVADSTNVKNLPPHVDEDNKPLDE